MNDKKTAQSIWARPIDTDALNAFSKGCMVSHVEIEFTEIGHDFLKARMPVSEKTMQPFGMLHGGASMVLAETLGSAAATCCVDDSKICVGVEINANHVRSATSGYVDGVTRPIHLGRTMQVWETTITDQEGRLVSTGRMTLAVLDKK